VRRAMLISAGPLSGRQVVDRGDGSTLATG
jgi:hypothetical protein